MIKKCYEICSDSWYIERVMGGHLLLLLRVKKITMAMMTAATMTNPRHRPITQQQIQYFFCRE